MARDPPRLYDFCAAQGIPVRLFMEWVGHEDYETMMIYNHYSPGGFELDILNAAAEREAQVALGLKLDSIYDQPRSTMVRAEQHDSA